ncbi:MAG: N-6 DNA methylase [Pyrinomonadaceae bacterium]|nr:N-6 DNA methylase [Pyrinomonadaceae bacterium]
MNKQQLEQIFSKGYQPALWRNVLTEVFSVTNLFQNPEPVILSSNKIAVSAFELGSLETSDDRLIGIYQVNLNDNPNIERNKVGLRELLRSIYKYDVDGALVVFVQGDKWRFSYISEVRIRDANDQIIIEETEPKRFTYLFGRGENTRTAAERFELLVGKPINLPALKAAFSVEKLSKDFFADYKDVFAKFETAIKQSIPDAKQIDRKAAEQRRLFTQRLFNRLMFIYFLQKKGWLSYEEDKNYLRRLFTEAEDNGENFYQDRLRWLFFSGLGVNENIDLHQSRILRERRGDVPYLNGGLFEKDDDGFDEANRVEIENALFHGLLNFFERYNFTVDESTPIDIEIAVDPEMLGKVFEELVTGRNESGSYYTPRRVVQFMCREALKNYLAETKIDAEKIKRLVVEYSDEDITIPEARKLLSHLENVKIVDPACGSGAYLLGILQELKTITALLDTKTSNSPIEIYERKLKIIQNNIYGVDMDAFAVQIARLRLWLSLAVDFYGDKPEPLPNLDFKIEQGDSLTAPNPNKAKYSGVEEKIGEYKKAKAEFFKSSIEHRFDAEHKKQLLEKIKKLREEISFWIHQNDTSKMPDDAFDWAIEFAEVFSPKVVEWRIDGTHTLINDVEIQPKLTEAQPVESTTREGGFDIVLANPPYGGTKVSDATRNAYFDNTQGSQSKDPYGIFIARGLQILRPNGVLSYIVSDTWRTIKSFRPLRHRILEQCTVKHFLDLPPWIFDATVNTCILTVVRKTANEKHEVIAGDLRNLPNYDWQMLEENLKAVAEHGYDAQTLDYARYTYPQSLISTYDNLSFFIASPELYRLMSDGRFTKLGDIADVKQGLATADNQYYLRKREGVRGSYEILDESKLLSDEEISNLSEDEKRNGINPDDYNGKHFLPFDKGGESESGEGWLPNYHVPTGYFIDWSKNAVNRLRTAKIADVKRRKGEESKIKAGDENKTAAVFRNPQYYFRFGLTFSPTGIYSPTFRLGCKAIFGNKGSTIFFNKEVSNYILGKLASTFVRYSLKNYLSHTVETGEEVLFNTPLVKLSNEDKEKIENLVNAIVDRQKENLQYPYHLYEQKEIDKLVYELYGLSPEDIREVEIWYCRRYAKLAEAQGFTSEVKERHKDFLAHCDLLLSKPPSYWTSHPVTKLIAEFEHQKLDFKEFFAVDGLGNKNSDVSKSTLKTIASFINADGGTILLGVDDSGNIKGIQSDLDVLKNTGNESNDELKDQFQLKIQNMIRDHLSPTPTGLIDISFEHLPEGIVYRIDAKSSKTPTYYDGKLYVRNGNQADEKTGHELTMWIQERTK